MQRKSHILVEEKWLVTNKIGKREASQAYNDIAIVMFSTFKSIYSLAGRQAEGFIKSLFTLLS